MINALIFILSTAFMSFREKPGTQVGAQNKDFGAVSQTGPGSSKG